MRMKKDIAQSILVVDDDESFRRLIKYTLKQQYHLLMAESAENALDILAGRKPDMILLDVILPGMNGLDLLRQIKTSWPDIPVLMLSATEQISTVVESIKAGAFDYLTKPIREEELFVKIDQAFAASHLSLELTQRRELQQETNLKYRLIGTSAALEKIRQQIETVGVTDSTVLIQGETGVGKEVVARMIHACSPRAEKPFVALNCGAIPKELLEAELFGYAKGAFTGAYAAKTGKFQLAHKGVLLLDEVGDFVRGHFTPRPWHDMGGHYLLEEIELNRDGARNTWTTICKKSGKTRKRSFFTRLYDKRRLSAALGKAGFKPLGFWGSFSGLPLTGERNRLIVLARKI